MSALSCSTKDWDFEDITDNPIVIDESDHLASKLVDVDDYSDYDVDSESDDLSDADLDNGSDDDDDMDDSDEESKEQSGLDNNNDFDGKRGSTKDTVSKEVIGDREEP